MNYFLNFPSSTLLDLFSQMKKSFDVDEKKLKQKLIKKKKKERIERSLEKEFEQISIDFHTFELGFEKLKEKEPEKNFANTKGELKTIYKIKNEEEKIVKSLGIIHQLIESVTTPSKEQIEQGKNINILSIDFIELCKKESDYEQMKEIYQNLLKK